MTHAHAHEVQALALDLHRFLRDLDPARWRAELDQATRARLAELERRLRALLEARAPTAEARFEALRERLTEIAQAFDRRPQPAVDAGPRDVRGDWERFRKELAARYEGLASALKGIDVQVPSLRPTNYARNVFHIGSAVGALAIMALWLDVPGMRKLALAATVWAWSMELLRRRAPALNRVLMAVFSSVAHPHEHHRVNSATWYASAMLILSLIGSKPACVVAVAVLGFGDPVAALVGRRFGRIKLLHGRTLEGSLAFVAAAGLGSVVALAISHGELGLGAILAMSGAGALVGAVAEAVAKRIDDNLLIPITSASAAILAGLALGAPLFL
jgi:dolichol kinase